MQTIQEKMWPRPSRNVGILKSCQSTTYDFGRDDLICLGYQLLSAKKISDAIELFKLSVEVYPPTHGTASPTLHARRQHPALKNYKKSLQVNPANTNAVGKLRNLSSP